MVSSGPELDQFLAELGVRRQRLLTLAEPPGPRPADLIDELHELSEQLIVADEELRVQQEELEAARAALLSLGAERDLLLQDSRAAYVVTDDRGVVKQATGAAQRLVRQPPTRVTTRPIASWFEVADRRAVRAVIGRVTATGERQQLPGVRILTFDDVVLRVGLVVERVTGVGDGRSLLRWELTPDARPLHAVPGSNESEAEGEALALRLAQAAVKLELCRTRDDLVGQVLETAVGLIPRAQHAGLVLQCPQAAPEPAAATSDVARRTDCVQLTERVGPLHTALTASTLSRSSRLLEEVWGPSSSSTGNDWPGCALAVPLLVDGRRLGVLTVYADQPEALDADAELTATALSLHVAVALRRLMRSNDLKEAVHARQLVGQAVGILVERHRLTPEGAFSLLVTWSQHANVKLRFIARALVETGQEPPALQQP